MGAAEAASANGQGLTSHAVVASMRRHDIRFTAANYAVWESYLTGSNPIVRRAIEIVLSNGGTIDQPALHRLYTRHFCPSQGALGVRQAAQRGLDQLDQTRTLLSGTSCPADVLARLEEVANFIRGVMDCTQALLSRLTQSEERIALLESHLNDATRDAATDSLTGLCNRRAFDAALRTMAAEAMNAGTDLAFVLIDVDHFKRVNDNWGHAVGDDVLRHVAALLTRTVRGGDLVARYGGEEFAVLLGQTGRRGAISVADNLREAVSGQPFALASQARAGVAAAQLYVTISAGISCYTPGEAIGQWLGRADEALYRAKGGGRNRVVFGSTGPSKRPQAGFAPRGAADAKGFIMPGGAGVKLPPDPSTGSFATG